MNQFMKIRNDIQFQRDTVVAPLLSESCCRMNAGDGIPEIKAGIPQNESCRKDARVGEKEARCSERVTLWWKRPEDDGTSSYRCTAGDSFSCRCARSSKTLSGGIEEVPLAGESFSCLEEES